MKKTLNQHLQLRLSVNYRNIIRKWLLTRFKFIIKKEYVLSDEEHISWKFKQKIKHLKKKFDFRNSVKYFTQKINFNKFFFIEKVLQQEEDFNSKN